MDDTPILVFLIPFASRRVKARWELACIHLRQTLKSIQNSANGNFRVVVAGHEAPDSFCVRLDSIFYINIFGENLANQVGCQKFADKIHTRTAGILGWLSGAPSINNRF